MLAVKKTTIYLCGLLLMISACYPANATKHSERMSAQKKHTNTSNKKTAFYKKTPFIIITTGAILIGTAIAVQYRRRLGSQNENTPNQDTQLTDQELTLTYLQGLIDNNNGNRLNRYSYEENVQKRINNEISDEVTVDKVIPLLTQELGKKKIDITKNGASSWLTLEYIYNTHNATIQKDNYIILDALLTLHTQLTNKEQTKEMINKAEWNDLIDESRGKSDFTFLNLLFKHGADPTIQREVLIADYIRPMTKEEKIKEEEKVQKNARKFNREYEIPKRQRQYRFTKACNIYKKMNAIEQAKGGYVAKYKDSIEKEHFDKTLSFFEEKREIIIKKDKNGNWKAYAPEDIIQKGNL